MLWHGGGASHCVADQRVAEAKRPTARGHQESQASEAANRDLRVERELASQAVGLQLENDSIHLLRCELDTEQRNQTGMRGQLARERSDLTFRQPLDERRVR